MVRSLESPSAHTAVTLISSVHSSGEQSLLSRITMRSGDSRDEFEPVLNHDELTTFISSPAETCGMHRFFKMLHHPLAQLLPLLHFFNDCARFGARFFLAVGRLVGALVENPSALHVSQSCEEQVHPGEPMHPNSSPLKYCRSCLRP